VAVGDLAVADRAVGDPAVGDPAVADPAVGDPATGDAPVGVPPVVADELPAVSPPPDASPETETAVAVVPAVAAPPAEDVSSAPEPQKKKPQESPESPLVTEQTVPPAPVTLVVPLRPVVVDAVLAPPVAWVLPPDEVRAPEVLGPPSSPVDARRRSDGSLVGARPVRGPEHGPTAAPVAAPVPAAAVAAQAPCPVVAAPSVATARPASPWSRPFDRDNGSQRDDLPPAAVSPAGVEHARSGSARGDLPPVSAGSASGAPTWVSAGPTLGHAGADRDLPAAVEPPQLRVLSSRAGPCPVPAPAP
jgi:hypothetical protein